MADINGAGLFDQKVRQFGMDASHAAFVRDYVRGINSSLSKLYTDLDLETAPTLITGTSEDIGLDSKYEQTLGHCVDFYLTLFEHKSGKLTLEKAEILMLDSIAQSRVRRDADARQVMVDAEDPVEEIADMSDDD